MLRRSVFAREPSEKELQLTSVGCKLIPVIHFWCAKNTASGDIHSQLGEVYGEKYMSIQHVNGTESTLMVQWRTYKRPWRKAGSFASGQHLSEHHPCHIQSYQTNLDGILSYTCPIAWHNPWWLPSLFWNKVTLGWGLFCNGREAEKRGFLKSYLRGVAEEFYEFGIKRIVHRMHKCIDLNSNYVEK